MDFLLQSIEQAAKSGAFFPAALTALTLPDIAGAVESSGRGSQARYAAWIDKWFITKFPNYTEHKIDGLVMYALRCKLLHDGLSIPADAPAAKKSPVGAQKRLIAFSVDPHIKCHLYSASDAFGDSWTILRAERFCAEMVEAARAWMATKVLDADAQQALRRLVGIRTDVPMLGRGIPVICAAL